MRRMIKPEIDLGLDVLCAVMRPGERLSHREIAEICECAPANIQRIEKNALRHIRESLRRKFGLSYDQFFGQGSSLLR